tara:strand:+ start:142 stop:342 length:201 start_codon:yes stop_codon:yes gene_type:complete
MFYVIIIMLVIWDIYWKIQSLWHAAESKEKGWFVVLLIFNTAGLLPIYYLYSRDYFKTKKDIKSRG